MDILGIDIGGSGIKAARVNTERGELVTERLRYETPEPPTPEAMLGQLEEIIASDKGNGPIGVGFPGVILENRVYTAVNLHPNWVNFDLGKEILDRTGRSAVVLNDADAAGEAEIHYGAGKDQNGVVIVLTIGTGIGSAIFIDGKIVPNTEIGHILMKDGEAEALLSKNTRKEEEISWKQWGRRFDKYLLYLESLFWPSLFIIGGGGAKRPERYVEQLTLRTKVIPASAGNRSGIIGAAWAAVNYPK